LFFVKKTGKARIVLKSMPESDQDLVDGPVNTQKKEKSNEEKIIKLTIENIK